MTVEKWHLPLAKSEATVADRDPDFEAADSLARQWEGFSDLANLKEARNIARAYLATRAREARLEALVRELLAYEPARGPVSPYWGLVEAARKELADGK